MRSAMTHPESAALLREFIVRQPYARLAQHSGSRAVAEPAQRAPTTTASYIRT
jgi:hypothetical protein